MKVQVEGKLRVGIDRLLCRYPLLGGIVATWEHRSGGTDTMAIGMSDEGFILYYCPAFVTSLGIAELVGVLHHELRHIVFGHLLMEPADYPDEEALTIAQEVTVNENLSERLPSGALRLDDYPGLKADEDTPTRYRRLCRNHKAKKRRADDRSANEGGWRDDHSRWREVLERGSLAGNLMDVALQEILDNHSGSLSPEESADLEHACRAWGLEAGASVSELPRRNSEARVDWRILLRRYVGSELASRPSYARPPRRFPPTLLGIVPGTARSCAKPTILAIIDTSGSMSDEQLADISNELRLLTREHRVTVVECDAKIQRVYRYRPITSVAGRGGTDFRPPLEPGFLRKYTGDLALVFTDGAGRAPDSPPQVPVMWVLTPHGKPPAPWGKVVRMAKKDH